MKRTTASTRPLRRKPQQARSVSRVDDILSAALALVGQKGIAALTMREIAKSAGMPLASVYQYFPNKSAVIATLYQSFSEHTREALEEALADIGGIDDILPAAGRIVDAYYTRVKATPAVQDLMNAIQADKALHNVDIAETREQAERFCAATQRLIREKDRQDYARAVYLLFQLAGTTVRLALMVEPDAGDQIVEDYKRLIGAQLAPFGG